MCMLLHKLVSLEATVKKHEEMLCHMPVPVGLQFHMVINCDKMNMPNNVLQENNQQGDTPPQSATETAPQFVATWVDVATAAGEPEWSDAVNHRNKSPHRRRTVCVLGSK